MLATVLMLSAAMPPALAQESRSLQDMLFAAIRVNDMAAVRSVIASGADIAKRSANGKTAIDLAVDLARFEIAELLVMERRRQRETQLAAGAVRARPALPAEIMQPSAEAPPEIAPAPAPIALEPPRAATVAAIALPAAPAPLAQPLVPASAAVTPEQLLAVAQQLAQAAQAMVAAQQPRVAAPPPRPVVAAQPLAPIEVAVAPVVEPFAPKPGRKPQPAQPVAAASAPLLPPPSDSIVVTPRRRSLEAEADRVRDSLEMVPDLDAPVPERASAPARPAPRPRAPAAAKPVAPVQPAALPALDIEPAAEIEATPVPAGDGDGELMRKIKGIGEFFGVGSEPKKTEPPAAAPRDLREHLREPPRRKNVPHVPAKRASDFRADAAPAPEETAPRTLAPRSLNPFDPETPPQGAVLPYTDPVAGDIPELAVPGPQASRADEPRTQFVLSPVTGATAVPAAKPRPAPAAPPLPQLAAAAPPHVAPPRVPELRESAEPTAAFERRPMLRATPPAPKEEPGILKSLATAVGLPDTDEPVGPASTEPGDAEKLTSRKMPIIALRPPLADVPLTLGASVTTEQRQLPRGLAEPEPCIRRAGGSVMFCIVPVDWPAGIDRAFSITTYLYQGSRAIARYDGGRASHYHALFASQNYKEVVTYFTNRFGPPTDEWKRSISPFDQPRQANPTLVWRSRDSRTNQVTVLEVRQYDDTRNVFPDMDHGAVRLYKSGAQRVFPVITGLDIMGIDWAARSDHNGTVDGRALANTIRSRR